MAAYERKKIKIKKDIQVETVVAVWKTEHGCAACQLPSL